MNVYFLPIANLPKKRAQMVVLQNQLQMLHANEGGGWIIGWENLVEITTAKLPKCRSHTILSLSPVRKPKLLSKFFC
jgi:hypothetical protein